MQTLLRQVHMDTYVHRLSVVHLGPDNTEERVIERPQISIHKILLSRRTGELRIFRLRESTCWYTSLGMQKNHM